MDPLNDSELTVQLPAELLNEPDPVGGSVRRLGKALAAASIRVEREMKGEPAFDNDHQRQTSLAILRQLTHLLPLLDRYPPPLDPDVRYIPPCPICNARAGEHWAHECPRLHRPDRDEMFYDYRKKRMLFYKQIKESCLPDPDEVFVCAVCRSRWDRIDRERMLEAGHDFGEQEAKDQFKALQERSLR